MFGWTTVNVHKTALFQCLILYKVSVAVEIAICLEIARTLHASSSNVDIVDRDITATALTAKDVVIPPLLVRSSRNVLNGDVLDDDTIGWLTSRTAVEVVLLNIYTVD